MGAQSPSAAGGGNSEGNAAQRSKSETDFGHRKGATELGKSLCLRRNRSFAFVYEQFSYIRLAANEIAAQ